MIEAFSILALVALGLLGWALVERGNRLDEEAYAAARQEMLKRICIRLEDELALAKAQAKDGYRQYRQAQADLEAN